MNVPPMAFATWDTEGGRAEGTAPVEGAALFPGLARPALLSSVTRTSPTRWALLSKPESLAVGEVPPGAFVTLDVATTGATRRCEEHPMRPYLGGACSAGARLDYVDDAGTQVSKWWVEKDGESVEITCGRTATPAVVPGTGERPNREASEGEKRAACAQVLGGATWRGVPLFPPPPAVAPNPRIRATEAACPAGGELRTVAPARGLPGYAAPACLAVRSEGTSVEWTAPGFFARIELVTVTPADAIAKGAFVGAAAPRGAVARTLAATPLRLTGTGPDGANVAALVPLHGAYLGFRCRFTASDGASLCRALHASLRDEGR